MLFSKVHLEELPTLKSSLVGLLWGNAPGNETLDLVRPRRGKNGELGQEQHKTNPTDPAQLPQIFWHCSQKSKKGMPSQEADLRGVHLPVQRISREHLSLRSRGREQRPEGRKPP